MKQQQGNRARHGAARTLAVSPLVTYLELIRVWCETVPSPLSQRESEDREKVVQSFAQFVAERGHARLSQILLAEGGFEVGAKDK